MKRQIKRLFILSIGSAFLLLGFVGLFLPFLQGILFLFIGLLILSQESQTARRLLDRWRQRHPDLDRRLKALAERLKKGLGLRATE